MSIRLRRGVFETELADMNAVREALASGTAGPDDEIWDPLAERWGRLADLLAVATSHGVTAPPGPAPAAGMPRVMPVASGGKVGTRSWSWIIFGVALAVFVAVLIVVLTHGGPDSRPDATGSSPRGTTGVGRNPAADAAREPFLPTAQEYRPPAPSQPSSRSPTRPASNLSTDGRTAEELEGECKTACIDYGGINRYSGTDACAYAQCRRDFFCGRFDVRSAACRAAELFMRGSCRGQPTGAGDGRSLGELMAPPSR